MATIRWCPIFPKWDIYQPLRKVAKHCVFPMICGFGKSKSKLAKAAGAEPAGQMRDEKVHSIVARSPFPGQNVQNTPGSDHFWKPRCRKSAHRCGAKHISKSKVYKAHQVRTTFGSCDVEKVHAVVARSTFASEKAKYTSRSDHFWKLRSRKSARRCGVKHICSEKTKYTARSDHFWKWRCRKSARRCGAKHMSKSRC